MAIANYVKTCAKNAAGASKIFIAEAGDASDMTVTSGEISAITMTTGTTFHEIDCNADSIRRVEEENLSNNALFINHKVELVIQKPSTTLNTLRASLHDALVCGAIVLVLDNNGEVWCVGWNDTTKNNNPLTMVEGNVDSGNSPEEQEMQSWSPVLSGKSAYVDLPLDSTLTATVLDGSATFITWN